MYRLYVMVGAEVCWPLLASPSLDARDERPGRLPLALKRVETLPEALEELSELLDGCRFEAPET